MRVYIEIEDGGIISVYSDPGEKVEVIVIDHDWDSKPAIRKCGFTEPLSDRIKKILEDA